MKVPKIHNTSKIKACGSVAALRSTKVRCHEFQTETRLEIRFWGWPIHEYPRNQNAFKIALKRKVWDMPFFTVAWLAPLSRIVAKIVRKTPHFTDKTKSMHTRFLAICLLFAIQNGKKRVAFCGNSHANATLTTCQRCNKCMKFGTRPPRKIFSFSTFFLIPYPLANIAFLTMCYTQVQ